MDKVYLHENADERFLVLTDEHTVRDPETISRSVAHAAMRHPSPKLPVASSR
jgi:hypothetical protein